MKFKKTNKYSIVFTMSVQNKKTGVHKELISEITNKSMDEVKDQFIPLLEEFGISAEEIMIIYIENE